MKKNNGVTIMSLVITIVVIFLMISIAGYYSIDSVRKGYVSSEKKELDNVIEYMGVLKTKLLIDEYSLSEDSVMEAEVLDTFSNILEEETINKIKQVNSSTLESKYKYHYMTNTKLSDKNFLDGKTLVKDARNNYIINFYTGTVIGLYGTRSDVSGIVFDLNDILVKIDE